MSGQYDQSRMEEQQMVDADYFTQAKTLDSEDPIEIFLQKMNRICFKYVVGKNQQLSTYNNNDYSLPEFEEDYEKKVQQRKQQQQAPQTLGQMFTNVNKDHMKLINCYSRFMQAYSTVSYIIDYDSEEYYYEDEE